MRKKAALLIAAAIAAVLALAFVVGMLALAVFYDCKPVSSGSVLPFIPPRCS